MLNTDKPKNVIDLAKLFYYAIVFLNALTLLGFQIFFQYNGKTSFYFG